MNIRETIAKAAAQLKEAEVGTPRLDAEVLLCHLLQCEKTYLIVNGTMELDAEVLEPYFSMVEKRAAGMPVQYITGRKEFMGLDLQVNEHVLIPRADTETMVEYAIETLTQKKTGVGGNFSVLDLCCGSGAIGISIASYIPKARVTATDVSEMALAVARANAEEQKVKKQMKFLQGDLFEPLKKKDKFDVIISNPPYIKTNTIDALQREIKNYEPRLALDGGADGLNFYRRIVPEAASHLKKNGVLYLEIGYDQGTAMKQMLEAFDLYKNIAILHDLEGFDRIVRAERK